MIKVCFKEKWQRRWGIKEMVLADDCKIIAGLGYYYVYCEGETIPRTSLRRMWIKQVVSIDGETETVLYPKRRDGEQNDNN